MAFRGCDSFGRAGGTASGLADNSRCEHSDVVCGWIVGRPPGRQWPRKEEYACRAVVSVGDEEGYLEGAGQSGGSKRISVHLVAQYIVPVR